MISSGSSSFVARGSKFVAFAFYKLNVVSQVEMEWEFLALLAWGSGTSEGEQCTSQKFNGEIL